MKNKTFNFLLLAMSTLNFDKAKVPGKNVLPKYTYVNDVSVSEPEEYYSQLEPVSREIIVRKGVVPDQIIVLCTKETLQKESFYLSDDPEHELQYSAYDFYKERISRYLPEEKRDIFSCIDIDVSNINLGIINAANLIINKKAEIEKNYGEGNQTEVKLWIDTQGSFREIILVMNAIMNLLKMQKISIAGIFSAQFNKKSNPASIIREQTENYRIFDFVSGMNEFIMYGRAVQLNNYYRNNCSDHLIINILNAMKKVADSIQMCDPGGFLEYKKQLRTAISEYEKQQKDISKELFAIFIHEVKDDYGVLLKDECTNIDIIDWFYRKQFYQQALTFIESKIPSELCEKNIIRFIYNKDRIYELKRDDRKGFEDDDNYLLFQFLIPISGYTINRLFTPQQANSDLRNNRQQNILEEKILYKCNKCGFLCEKNNGVFEIPKSGETLTMILCDAVRKDIDMLRKFLFLFSVLKKERNKFNHMSDNSKDRATKQELDLIISLFVELGKKIYKAALNK